MITYVYAQDLKGAIGYQNDLPWHLPSDLKFFKEVTMGHTMLMGRTTFESMDRRILPGRKTVVLTSQEDYGKDIDELELVHSVEDVLELAKNQELMVIGGAGVFKSLMEHVDKILRTVIEGEFPADTYMPDIDQNIFRLDKVIDLPADDKNPYPHRFEWWVRK
ncbi:dihydrofolate reductase [Facklamia miroungae]|uniref:Dihydrofolate reductase n=1 Tax=Facklamia miroungae TaxID=120956 RepID=A0A1G7P8K6_9LACT|nr:dihydrofolate reductase [Facklamia miroungae]NKZ28600.1 dihydrofolate reductase [Facklamia miroungae]SDF81929.1 dihydrofolate reductase/thymidylate synthase [Facklamia miroungae]